MEKIDDIEFEKMIIDIPKKAIAVSVVTIVKMNGTLGMNTHTYDTQDVVERKVESGDGLNERK